MSGNDYQSWGPDNDPYVTAVAQGIRDTDPSALQTVELNYLTSGSLDDPAWAPLIDLNASYTYDPTYVQVLKDYNRSNFLPTFMVEASYEDEQNPGGPGRHTPTAEAAGVLVAPERRHRAALTGTTRPGSSSARSGTPTATASAAGRISSHRRARHRWRTSWRCSRPRPWYDLVPDQNHTLVTSGYGTFGDDDYVTAARTPDGKLAMAYVPSGALNHRRSRNAQRPGHRPLVRPDRRDVHDDRRRPFANNGSVTLGTPPRTPQETTTGCSSSR